MSHLNTSFSQPFIVGTLEKFPALLRVDATFSSFKSIADLRFVAIDPFGPLRGFTMDFSLTEFDALDQLSLILDLDALNNENSELRTPAYMYAKMLRDMSRIDFSTHDLTGFSEIHLMLGSIVCPVRDLPIFHKNAARVFWLGRSSVDAYYRQIEREITTCSLLDRQFSGLVSGLFSPQQSDSVWAIVAFLILDRRLKEKDNSLLDTVARESCEIHPKETQIVKWEK